LIDAIEASIAIPLIARPVAHQGRYMLDGGFWDCAPVDAAGQLGVDVIVAVELGKPFSLPINLRTPAGWIAEKMARVPQHRTMAGVPFSINAFVRELVPGREADIVIRPPLTRLRGNSPFHMTQCLDAGIEATRQALPAIRALLAGQAPAHVAQAYPSAPELRPSSGRAFA
jgi:NTE family protein